LNNNNKEKNTINIMNILIKLIIRRKIIIKQKIIKIKIIIMIRNWNIYILKEKDTNNFIG
jgi:hypothetical protein